MQRNFWYDKSVFVTGDTGFLGSHLVRFLKKSNANVVTLGSRSLSDNSDIRNFNAICAVMKKTKPFACYHLAGKAIVEDGQNLPYDTFNTNILGTLNILEASRIFNIERIIIASTAQVYGNIKTPAREFNPPRPTRPYETSKTAVDLIAQSYADTYDLPVLIPRFVNTYGPGDLNMSRVIPKTIQSILNNVAPSLWGGNAKREYLYIDDTIHALDLLGRMNRTQIKKNRIINFGSDDAITVKDLMKKILFISNASLRLKNIDDERKMEIKKQVVSWSKAKRLLGWYPKTTLDVGLKKTVDWYREYYGGTNDSTN